MKSISLNEQKSSLILIVLLIMFFTATNSKAGETRVLRIKTVDEKNTLVKPEIVRWWFSVKPEIKNTLVCRQDDCSRLKISGNLSSSVTVYALLSKIQENDQACWDWYESEIEAQARQKEITLMLTHKRTACQ